MKKSCRASPSVHHYTVAQPTPSAGGVVHRKVKGGFNQLEVRSQRPDSCETGGKFLPQRGADTDASVRLHVIRYTSSKAQLYLKGGDVYVHVRYGNVFALQLHVEGVQVRNDVRQANNQIMDVWECWAGDITLLTAGNGIMRISYLYPFGLKIILRIGRSTL